MKKILIGALLAALLIQPSFAGLKYQSIGLKIGYNFSTITGTMPPDEFRGDHYTIQTYSAGIYAVFNLRGYLFLQPELLYSGKGFLEYRNTWNCFGGPDYRRHHFEYIDLPILLKLSYFSDSDQISPTVIAGPCVSYFNKYYLQGNGWFAPDYSTEEDARLLGRWEVSGIFGIGLDYKQMVMDIRYQQSFTQHQKFRDVKNEVWSLMFGFNL